MKKSIRVGIVILLLIGMYFGLIWAIKEGIKNQFNSNPDRRYTVAIEKVSVSLIKGSVEIYGSQLVPAHEEAGIRLTGSFKRLLFSGFHSLDLIFSKELILDNFILEEPAFRIELPSQEREISSGSRAFQELFKDLIDRGEIQNFEIIRGTFEVYRAGETPFLLAETKEFNLQTKGIRTDRTILTHLIPFEVDSFKLDFQDFMFQAVGLPAFQIESFDFDLDAQRAQISGMRYGNEESLISRSQAASNQEDLISFSIAQVWIEGMDTDRGSLGIWSAFANKMTVDSLYFSALRNKNKPRKSPTPKKLFLGLLESLPIPLDIDSLLIRNSRLEYSEIPRGDSSPGTISFENLQAKISGLITIDSLRKSKAMKLQVQADFLGEIPLTASIRVPYDREAFFLQLSLGSFDLQKLNQFTVPLAQVKIHSGRAHHLDLTMNADSWGASTQFRFDYENFQMELLTKGQIQNSRILGILAGKIGTRSSNMPGQKNYRVVRFRSKRDQNRGPFNFIWATTKEGILETVPSGTARLFLKK